MMAKKRIAMVGPQSGADDSEDFQTKPTSPERILESATSNFLQYGYEGTSIVQIAQDAGMTPANIYWHFPSKLDLLFVSLENLYQSSYQNLTKAVGNGSAEQRLRQYVEAFVTDQLRESSVYNFGYSSLVSALTEQQREKLRARGRPYIDLLKDILNQGIQEGVFRISDITHMAFAIATMCEYVFTWYNPSGGSEVNVVARNYAEFAVGLAKGNDG